MPDTPRRRVPNWLRLLILVPLARLRFLIILGAIAFVLMKWDYLSAKYEQMTYTHQSEASGDHEYFCPMHPSIVRASKKDKCPICFMPLSKRKKGEASDASLPEGIASRVQLSPYRIVLAGVKTVPVAYHTVTKEIATIGTVEFDERSLKNVSARVKGRIDELFVNQTGQLVKKDQPLAKIYSPDLVVTVESLLSARKAGSREAEDNARERLRRWGIDDKQIDKILADGKPIQHLTIVSPINGHVIKKYPREGQYVEEGGPLYDVADISTVWVQAQLYEDDLAFLPKDTHDPKTGLAEGKLKVAASARAFPGRTFNGVLSFVFPHLDQESRTLSVRFELKNLDHELRPGMSATVSLQLDVATIATLPAGEGLQIRSGQVLVIPELSIIDTGAATYVYREDIPGQFDGIKVELGPRLLGPNREILYPVLKGLKENDRLVTTGSFLIDAETRLNHNAGSIYIGGSGSKSASPTLPSTPDNKNAKVEAALKQLLPEDQRLARAQKICPIDKPLGEMGKPVKIMLKGQPVFLCCVGCVKSAEADPDETLKKVAELTTKK